MKGQVLGFDGTTGAITTEGGERFSFTLADWKGERPPQPRDPVDFVAKDGVATEVYLTQSSISAAFSGLGDGVKGGAGALAFIATRPQLIVEVVAIIAVFLFHFVALRGEGVSAIGLPGRLDDAADGLSMFSDRGDGLGAASVVAYLLWLIPVIGGFAIYREVIDKRHRLAELLLAIFCLLSIPIYWITLAAFSSLTNNRYVRRLIELDFGLGGYLLVICGVLLLLTVTSRIKRVPGL
ncbi:MAG: hypothetical protein ACOY45_15475 [Pseudomonadota bacterium]